MKIIMYVYWLFKALNRPFSVLYLVLAKSHAFPYTLINSLSSPTAGSSLGCQILANA